MTLISAIRGTDGIILSSFGTAGVIALVGEAFITAIGAEIRSAVEAEGITVDVFTVIVDESVAIAFGMVDVDWIAAAGAGALELEAAGFKGCKVVDTADACAVVGSKIGVLDLVKVGLVEVSVASGPMVWSGLVAAAGLSLLAAEADSAFTSLASLARLLRRFTEIPTGCGDNTLGATRRGAWEGKTIETTLCSEFFTLLV